MDVETTPPQPDDVTRELAALLAEALADERPAADPWWRAGLAEALGE